MAVVTTQQRRRAPAMSLDERRGAIVQAALPLLVEHGAHLSTRQVADAAEIAEGTVFRVFADKDELLRACLSEAFRTDDLCARIRQVPVEQDVPARLVDAGMLVLEHMAQLGAMMQSLAASGYNIHQQRAQDQDQRAAEEDDPARFMRELTDATTVLLAPDEHRLRIPADQLVRMFLGLLTSTRFDPLASQDRRAAVAQRVDVLLNGGQQNGPQQT